MSHRPTESGEYRTSPPNHRYSHLDETQGSQAPVTARYDVEMDDETSQPLRHGTSPLHSPAPYQDRHYPNQNQPYPNQNPNYPNYPHQPYPPPPGHNVGYEDSPDPNASTVWSAYDKVDPDTYATESKSKLYESNGTDADVEADGMIVKQKKKKVHATEVIATTRARRWWIRITWLLTWWVPSFLLTHVGKMKRPDVRMAWREKLAIFEMIILSCGIVLFYIIVFGKLLCPNSDKAWNTSELATHQGEDDYMAAIAGKVYDFTKFYKGQHSDLSSYTTSADVMLQFAGQDLTNYFPPPMTVACPGLVTNEDLSLSRANFTPIVSYAVHTSGKQQTITGTKLDADDWYTNRLMPDLKKYYKGSLVFDKGTVESGANSDSKQWAIYKKKVYDLSDYLYTLQYYSSSSGTDLPNYKFLNEDISGLFQTSAGQDITKSMNEVLAGLSQEEQDNNLNCLNNAFYLGEMDFRKESKCLVQNYLLLAFSIIIMATIGAKFLAALQLGSKRQPELLDKFVICQVPCYTEGEESLKKTIDSLAALKYDDKRKLIFIICDGNIIGSGNNRPTPRIVLDLLGVDPKLDPEPLLFKSIGEGSKQLNYGKIYSGLYEFEGHVVPYVVVVKVGKPSETSKPGNRGKRDSQVLLMQYLNRVHFEAPMSPLELEIYHQMRNVIGIDPAFYEYIFQVDADTTVTPDSLNRLISCTSDDSKIIGICGETKVANEKESLTTMIQVYEYYISHHLTKAFESLFGSVTCLPGCFSVYRIRTADKGRPVIISSIVIDEYAEPNVDTLHKKNLFSLGEDRYLTTLMMKHFPTFKMKFTPDAVAHTVAPSRWNVLLSQRRRWINSTIHNLAELLFLPEMCGFCLFSMRWIVFLDLLGTIILPATCVYLIYLIIVVSTKQAAVPVISLAMIGAVYGLQALIFIIKREFMLVGWMVVYILAFPVYSIFLPLYSFWSMDDFSWGNTRKVVGEGNQKTVVYEDDEPFNEGMIPYRTFKEYEANAWETASLHSEKSRGTTQTSVSRNLHPYPISNRAPSFHSSVSELPPGADYWRDSSPLGPQHSSRNLRHAESNPSLRAGFNPRDRVQSMAGMSMWGNGSNYDMNNGQGLNPMFTGGSFMDNGSMRGSTFYPPPSQQFGSPMMNPLMMGMNMGMNPMGMPGHMSPMNAPRNTVMSGLGGMGGNNQSRMSSYSLATTANLLGAGGERDKLAGLSIDERSEGEVADEEVLEKLRGWLGKQDLMNVTKRQTRETIYTLFPNANLQSRAAWLNENIDKILSES
uniref:chitin synthase n=1 Tax=Kwoniella bestiolae CBS 10118 TaxID=1296100 RepID=A0A1B9G7V2_9TREE|nr:chitin synthase [Kwoniella bestiolae CBS 10118]OCF27060.1 chitin synthase [Kwoniella bestiolae CBS 10118]